MNRHLVFLLACATLSSQLSTAQPFPDRIDLGSLSAGEGFALNGVSFADEAGYRVAGIGDFNGDGFDDVAISAISADPNGDFSGSVYVYTGRTALNLTTVELSDLDGTSGFRIDGLAAFDRFGIGLAGPGDINGDGLDDLLIGASGAEPNGIGSGQVYVVFGTASFPAVIDANDLDGENGARINGIEIGDAAGEAVGGAGDFNGDGLDDFVVGAVGADPNGLRSGEVYIGFGRTTWPAELELSSLNDSTGIVIRGANQDDSAGTAVAQAGDINGDGFGDVLIGAEFADPNGLTSGEAYVVFGRDSGPETIELGDLDGLNGVTFAGVGALDFTGNAVSGLGDLNGDGLDDIAIGACECGGADQTGTGKVYIVYGQNTWSPRVELSDLDGTNGVVVNGIATLDQLGRAVSGAGDFNGDGLIDALLGAPLADPMGNDSGESTVAFGSDALPATIDLSDINGLNGVTFEGTNEGDSSGWSVSSAGDFNGDGVGDIILGSPDGNSGTGLAHVAFGRYESGITLGATGNSCPGPVSIRAKGLTPISTLDVYGGSRRGSSTIQSGNCSGVEIDLESALRLGTVQSNGLGQFLLELSVPDASLCGTFVQIVDLATCDESNVTNIPLSQNKALLLEDREGGYLNAFNDSSFDLTEAITIEAWALLDVEGDFNTDIAAKDAGGGLNAWQLLSSWTDNGGRPSALLIVEDGGGGASLWADATTDTRDGRWHHYAMTYSTADGTLRIYIDGVLEDSAQDFAGRPIQVTTSTNVNIGRKSDGNPDFFFSGQIDEVRIWNTARTTAEIQETLHQTIPNPQSEETLMAYYSFDVLEDFSLGSDGLVDDVRDLSPAGNDGDLVEPSRLVVSGAPIGAPGVGDNAGIESLRLLCQRRAKETVTGEQPDSEGACTEWVLHGSEGPRPTPSDHAASD